MVYLRIIFLTGSVLITSCSSSIDVAITTDLELQKQARYSPHYDGKLFMEIVDMVPMIAAAKLEDYYDKDEVERRAEQHLLHKFCLKYFRLLCSMRGCQHGGKCVYREASEVITQSERMGLTEKLNVPLPDNIAEMFTTSNEQLGKLKQGVIDELWNGRLPGLNWYLVSGNLPDDLKNIISFPDNPIKQRHAENMVEATRQVTWRHLINLSIPVLDKIARAANNREALVTIVDKYIACDCILGFTGKTCETCSIYDTFMTNSLTPAYDTAKFAGLSADNGEFSSFLEGNFEYA